MPTSAPLPLFYTWPTPLISGTLLRRYERFVAEVDVEGTVVKAHCVNPGRMEGLVIPDARVFLSRSSRETRALAHTWELIEIDGRLIGTNTGLPNTLVAALLKGRYLQGLDRLDAVVPEQSLGNGHRVDFQLTDNGETHWLEVKNCHLVYPDGVGYFPDSSSERAVSHVRSLEKEVKKGRRATVLFTVQRDDAQAVRPSALHCPEFATALRKAHKNGVDVRAVKLVPTQQGFVFAGEIPVDVKPYRSNTLTAWSQSFNLSSGWERKDGKWAGRSIA